MGTPLLHARSRTTRTGALRRLVATGSAATALAAAATVVGATLPAQAVRPVVEPQTQGGSAPGAAEHRLGCAQRARQHLSLEQEVGQLFLVGVDVRPTSTQLALVARDHLGGVMLAHNSRVGVRATRAGVDRVRDAATDRIGMWVAADQEGGYVQHLRGSGFSDIPTAAEQGGWTPADLRTRARTWGDQLRRAGVDLALGPVADTVPSDLGARNAPIGYYHRAYGSRPDVVAAHARAVHRGLRDARVQTVVKHFPGLGRVRGNTDVTPGVTDRTTTRHDDAAVQPFRALIEDDVPVVMVSSARYARIDATHVGPMSATIMQGMLRHDLGFHGVVMSDDLGAAALVRVPSRLRALQFLQAGGDVALVASATAAAPMYDAVLAAARAHPRHHPALDAAVTRVLRAKARAGLLTCGDR